MAPKNIAPAPALTASSTMCPGRIPFFQRSMRSISVYANDRAGTGMRVYGFRIKAAVEPGITVPRIFVPSLRRTSTIEPGSSPDAICCHARASSTGSCAMAGRFARSTIAINVPVMIVAACIDMVLLDSLEHETLEGSMSTLEINAHAQVQRDLRDALPSERDDRFGSEERLLVEVRLQAR